jgi:hypothetical protein
MYDMTIELMCYRDQIEQSVTDSQRETQTLLPWYHLEKYVNT